MRGGLALLASGDVLNRGTISGGIGASNAGVARIDVQLGGGTLENDGLVQGGAYGVNLGAAGLVTNNGQIAGGAAGVALATGSSLANAVGATITGGAAGAALRAGAGPGIDERGEGYNGGGGRVFLPEFETHDCLLAEGAWSESFADGPGLRRHFQNRAEFHALFKDYREPPEILLCAPRPLQGVTLERALRPVTGGLGQPVGALRGCIDLADGRLAEGWAQDTAWPFLPQALELFVDGQKLGEALACHFREDLAREGVGAGRAAFSFIAPRRFNPAWLTIRRAGDGTEIRSALGSQPSTSASGRSMPRVFSVCHTPSAV